MKKTILIFILASISSNNSLTAQSPTWLWAQSAGGVFGEKGQGVCVDVSGNVIMTGHFESPTITFGTTTLTNSYASGRDIYIVKYSPTGVVLWAQSAGGPNTDLGTSVSTDTNGNVFMTGHYFSPTLVFGTTTLTNPGNYMDVFIVKYSPTGTALWAKSLGGTSYDMSFSVSTDINGNVFVAGAFYSSSIVVGTTTLNNMGAYDNFMVKYSPSGSVLWANSTGGAGWDFGNSLSTDATGNVVMTGYFQSPTIVFGTFTLTNSNSGNVSDMFVVKYSPTGVALWAKSARESGGSGVSCDATGNLIVTGTFSSATIAFGTTTLNNAGYNDIFFVKYSPTGTELWAKSAGGSSDDVATSVSCDYIGNIYMTGSFSSPSIQFGTTMLNNISGKNIFITKYSPAGNALWASTTGGYSIGQGNSVSADASGNLYMCGEFQSGSLVFGAFSFTNSGIEDLFIVKLNDVILNIAENASMEFEISIYPNPFSSHTTISFVNKQTNTNIRIIDVLGKEIVSIPHFQDKQLVIEKGIMETGIYFVQVIDEKNNVVNKKVVLE